MRLRYVGYSVFLVTGFLVGSVVGVYRDLWPVCRQRGLCASRAILETPLTRFDGPTPSPDS